MSASDLTGDLTSSSKYLLMVSLNSASITKSSPLWSGSIMTSMFAISRLSTTVAPPRLQFPGAKFCNTTGVSTLMCVIVSKFIGPISARVQYVPQYFQMVIKCWYNHWILEIYLKWISDYSQSLSFETIFFQKLFITICRDKLGCFFRCFAISWVKTTNCVKQIHNIWYCPAYRPAFSFQWKIIG